MSDVRVRFAPSPTGNLHIGTARTALLNWLYAHKMNGSMILRVEDTDRERSTSEFEHAIMQDLLWMGLNWNEGPDIGGPFGPYRQSERLKLYQNKVDELIQSGYAYYCYCSPEELEERRTARLSAGIMPKYEGTCRELSPDEILRLQSEGRKPTVRFRVPEGIIVINDLVRGDIEFSSEVIGDFIILRSDGTPSYHLAVVVDDGEMEITHVIRGEDHITNTAKHVPLFKSFAYKVPKFAHNAMILGPDGGKLSKRHGATSVGDYRAKGYLPEAINNYLALLSWSPGGEREVFSLDELANAFEITEISKSAAIFDIDKLNWLNGIHIRSADLERITGLCIPYLQEAGLIEKGDLSILRLEFITKIVEAVRGNLIVLSEIPLYAAIFLRDYEVEPDAMEWLQKPHVPQLLDELSGIVRKRDELDIEVGKEIIGELKTVAKEHDIKGKDLFMPVRVALTGALKGPELPYVLNIFGRNEVLHRIEYAKDIIR